MSVYQKNKKSQLKTYLRFSSMAIQMGVVITLGAFSGSLLDKYFNTLTPIFTAILSLIAIFLSLYYFLRGFISKK